MGLVLGSLFLVGCKPSNEAAHAKEVDGLLDQIERQRNDLAYLDKIKSRSKELTIEAESLRRQVRKLESELNALKADDEGSIARRERAQKVRSARPAPAVPIKEMAKRVLPSVVVIEGDASSGSGFILREGEKTYLYTAAHVLSGNSKLTAQTSDGTQYVKFGGFELAEGYDMARLEIEGEVADAAKLADPSALAIKRRIFAVGNSGGSGVLTVLDGEVTGLGPSEFELSSEIIKGNSGGPVFDAESGDVMGLVTRAMAARDDIWSSDTRFTQIRRFAGRLDGTITWKRMPIGSFLNERKQIDEIDRGTKLLFALSMLRPTTAGLRMDTKIKEGVTAMQIFNENQDQQAVKDLIEMNGTLGARGMTLSERDLVKKFMSFYQQILSHGQRQTKSFNPAGFSSYHRKEAELTVKWRQDAERAVVAQLANMSR
jgi:serine protease Do